MYRLSELIFFFILKVVNIRRFILIAVDIFHNIYVNEGNTSLFDFLPSSQDSNVYLRNLHTFIRPTQWTHLVKRLHMCEIVCWRKCTWHKQKHWRILHENDTKRRIQQALCKIKKKLYRPTLYSIFQHVSII